MPVKKRTTFFILSTFLLCCLIPVYVVYRQMRQVKLDQALIHALRHLDSEKALRALAEGANANACEVPQVQRSFWQTLPLPFVRQPNLSSTDNAPSALLVAVDWRWQDAPQVGHWVNDGYIPANAPPQDPRVIQALLEHGADVNVTNEVGLTPLQIAAWEGKSSTVRLLLEHRAAIDVHGTGKWQATPLILAISGEDIETVRVLLGYHADINTIRDDEGFTALTLAQLRENKAIAALVEQAAKQK